MSVKKIHRKKNIQQRIFLTLLVLASAMTIILAIVSMAVSIKTERNSIDRNLENVAQTVSGMQLIQSKLETGNKEAFDSLMYSYLDSIKKTMSDVDVISVVGTDNIRKYHTNSSLAGTEYDGTLPDFGSRDSKVYVSSDIGPSGSQRRAYAAIYDESGNYIGFVLAVILNDSVNRIILNTIAVHSISAVAVIFLALILSKHLSNNIKQTLYGFEPDKFSEMFNIRDEILESLEEGIVASDCDERIVFINRSARKMLKIEGEIKSEDKADDILPYLKIGKTLASGERVVNVPIRFSHSRDILADRIPVIKDGYTTGALCILRDKTEYTKMMEDLSGVRYMVECMRANNHDFTNKLHVILGLIQMGRTEEASEYISHIASIQQTLIHSIMTNIEDPSIAALLIGKYSRAAELNIKFTLESGSNFSKNDISLPSCDLVTIIGNLLENAMDSINEKDDMLKELSIGLFTQPHALIIQVDDTGMGIPEKYRERIFENGFSLKGGSHGTGLFIVNKLVRKYNGSVEVNSEYGVGTSFTVTLTDEEIKQYV